MTDLIMYLREEIYDSAENDRDNAVYHYSICIIHTFCTIYVHSVSRHPVQLYIDLILNNRFCDTLYFILTKIAD